MPRQHIQWLPNLQLAQFHCSLGACSSALQTTFSPTCGAWHSSPALAPGGSGMEKDTSLDKVEQAGARLMHKLPAAVWLSDLPCVILHHNQHKTTEIYSSQNTEVAPVVFCRTVWGAGVAWVLLTALCTEAWSICPASVPESEHRVTSTRSHRELDKLPTLFGSQGPLHSPGSKNQTPCPLDVRIGLATKALTFTFHYELHEGSSY